jgi:malyl-CoA/(S)-citramalyl-CoA lyase
VPELARQVDVVLGNLEDAIPADAKEAARAGFIAMAKATDFGATGCGRASTRSTRPGRSTTSPIVGPIGNKLDVVMLPKVEGPGTSTISTSCWRSSKRGTASASRS